VDASGVRGMSVLVVDDDGDARDLVRRLLEDWGVVVTTAGSSAEALNLMGEQRFDMLVSDIGMPGEDGHALIRKVRALATGHGGDTPALALTAYARPEDRDKAIRAGFQDHTTKPVDPATLLAVLSRLGNVKRALETPARAGTTSA
jgi:CheY-like chemotaxis protein